jgi:hypothetical protein
MSYSVMGGTNVGVGQMSGGTNVGGAKVTPPLKTMGPDEKRSQFRLVFQFKIKPI